jgi:hypothetical protein
MSAEEAAMRGPIARRKASLALSVFVTGAVAWPVFAADGIVVRVKTTCEAMVPDLCQGGYGFRIDQSGAFVLGPAPDSRSHQGQGAEPRLFALAERALADPASSRLVCPPIGSIPGTRETVSVNSGDRALILKGDGGVLDPRCGPEAGRFAELFQAADAAMRRRYPAQFR